MSVNKIRNTYQNAPDGEVRTDITIVYSKNDPQTGNTRTNLTMIASSNAIINSKFAGDKYNKSIWFRINQKLSNLGVPNFNNTVQIQITIRTEIINKIQPAQDKI
jgi:hypothetical protein